MDTGEIPVEWPDWKEEYRHNQGFGGASEAYPADAFILISNASQVQRDLRTIEGSLDWRYNGQIGAEQKQSTVGPNLQFLREEYDRQVQQLDLSSQLKTNAARIESLERALELELSRRKREEKKETEEARAKQQPPPPVPDKPEAPAAQAAEGLEQVAIAGTASSQQAKAAEKEIRATTAGTSGEQILKDLGSGGGGGGVNHKHVFSRKFMKQLV